MSDKMPLSEIRRILENGEWLNRLHDSGDPDAPEPWAQELFGAIDATLDELAGYETTCRELRAEVDRLKAELSAYQEAEKDGRLVRLPVQVGQTVYVIVNPSINIIGITPCLDEVKVCSVEFKDNRYPRRIWIFYTDGVDSYYHGSEIGKSVFLTRAEAETALQALRAEAWGMEKPEIEAALKEREAQHGA